jgi:hypothetical protein
MSICIYISGDLDRVSFGTLKARILPATIGNKFLSKEDLRRGLDLTLYELFI